MSHDHRPLKVQHATKERIRLGAAVLACTHGDFVDRAVAEYLENHKDDLKERVEQAREALLGRDETILAYLRRDCPACGAADQACFDGKCAAGGGEPG